MKFNRYTAINSFQTQGRCVITQLVSGETRKITTVKPRDHVDQ